MRKDRILPTAPIAGVVGGEVVDADALNRVVRELESGDTPEVVAARREAVAEPGRRPTRGASAAAQRSAACVASDDHGDREDRNDDDGGGYATEPACINPSSSSVLLQESDDNAEHRERTPP